jgi:hypothetical protein
VFKAAKRILDQKKEVTLLLIGDVPERKALVEALNTLLADTTLQGTVGQNNIQKIRKNMIYRSIFKNLRVFTRRSWERNND